VVLRFPSLRHLDVVVNRLAAFEERYNQTTRPFKWKFTTTDLDDLLTRLDKHQPERHTTPPNHAQPDPRRTYRRKHLASRHR
jgi:hypothetical protein